jgi:prepilin-type N-terminal cleavage/methylation domain-containing protein
MALPRRSTLPAPRSTLHASFSLFPNPAISVIVVPMASLPPSFARVVQRILHWAASRCTAASPSVFISVHQWFKKSPRRPLSCGILAPWNASHKEQKPDSTQAKSIPSDQHFYSTGVAHSPLQAPISYRSPVESCAFYSTRLQAPARSALRLSTLASRPSTGFTLIELLVVISIIAILAALAFPAVNGAIDTARRGEVRSMADQIKKAISTYYAEYGIFPTNFTTTDAAFVTMMTTNSPQNRRGIRLMEIPTKFSNASGLVTPLRFYRQGQSNFTIVVDSDYNGQIIAPDGSTINASVAVGVPDPKNPNNWLGTWK